MTANAVLPFKSGPDGRRRSTDRRRQGRPAARYGLQPVSTAYVGLYGIPMGREKPPSFLPGTGGHGTGAASLGKAVMTGPIDVIIEFHKPLNVDEVGGRKSAGRPRRKQLFRRGAKARALAGLAGTAAAGSIPRDVGRKGGRATDTGCRLTWRCLSAATCFAHNRRP